MMCLCVFNVLTRAKWLAKAGALGGVAMLITGCSGGNSTSAPASSSSPVATMTPTPAPVPEEPALTNMKSFTFGHSLIAHTPPAIPTPSDETTVPHWLAKLAEAGGFQYRADGQFGFLRQHAELPPTPQWSFQEVSGSWSDSSPLSFADVDYTTVILTAANFIQYQPDTSPYDGDNPTDTTPLAETLKIIDWVAQQEPSASIYIYENWPDMGGRIRDFPPSSAELSAYHAHTMTSFHTWWLDYHDNILAARPNIPVKMIPVGPVIANLLTNTALSNIPVAELYEDDAPHGRPTLYFLAALVTYTATYGVPAPSNFEVPDTVHSLVKQHYDDVVMSIWNELSNFNTSDGSSRVW